MAYAVANHTFINAGVMIYDPDKARTPWGESGDQSWTAESNSADVIKVRKLSCLEPFQ
jgi:hypothetical protein